MQLFTPVLVNLVEALSTKGIVNDDHIDSHRGHTNNTLVDPAAAVRLFDDSEIQNLRSQGVISDKDWQQARDSVKAG